MPKTESILDRLSNDPDISGFTREELTEAQSELVAAIRGYAEAVKDKTSDDPKADLEAAGEAKERLEAVRTALGELDASDEELAVSADALLEGLEPEAVEETEETETPEAETDEAVEDEAEEVVEEVIEEPIAVAAAAPSIGAIARRAPKLPEPEKALVASAGPGISGEYAKGFADPVELGAAALKYWKSFGSGKPRHEERHLVASFDTGANYKYQVNGELEHDAEVVDALVKEVRNSKEPATAALVASGGFCAPAEPVYDFFSISDQAGMIQLPTVGAPRGRLTYPVSPSYATIRANAEWRGALANEHTNTEDIAGATKPSFAVTCPEVLGCEVAAYSTILQFGNFAQRFYPEQVAHAIAESTTFAAHKVNQTIILAMVAASTAVGGGSPGGGSLLNVAQILSFEAAKYRDNFRMSPTASLDLVAPAWVHDALAADLVARDSTQTFENAKGRVAAVFAGFGLNVQLVQDWQSIADANFGGYPATADFLLFAPGTFIRLDEGRLDLGIVRDSTLNATNDFQTFTETFEGVCEIGHDAWLVDDVQICPTGATGARGTITCVVGS